MPYQILLSGQDSGSANYPFNNSMGLEVWLSCAVLVPSTGKIAFLEWQEPLMQTPAWVYQRQGCQIGAQRPLPEPKSNSAVLS